MNDKLWHGDKQTFVDRAELAPPPAGTATAADMDALVSELSLLAARRSQRTISAMEHSEEVRQLVARAFQALQDSNRTLAHQLERRADGMDPLTQDLRQRAEQAERKAGELRAALKRIISIDRMENSVVNLDGTCAKIARKALGDHP